MTTFSCNNSFTYVLHIIILDVSETAREKKREAITTIKKNRNKIRNLWLWFVCSSLLPTCYFHQPFTYLLYISYNLSIQAASVPL